MLNKQDFDEMRQKMERFDDQRESLIKRGRDLIKLSKEIIYSTHRNEIKAAESKVKEIKSVAKELKKIAEKHPELYYSGSFKQSFQEYVEALCYYEFVKNKKIPTHKELDVEIEHYLLGLCDLTGELVRNAIIAAVGDDVKQALSVKSLVEELYWELVKFDFRNSELRRKFDSIKYDLKKLEDLILQLKLQKKI